MSEAKPKYRPPFTPRVKARIFERIRDRGSSGISLTWIRSDFRQYGKEDVDEWIETLTREGVIEIRDEPIRPGSEKTSKVCRAVPEEETDVGKL